MTDLNTKLILAAHAALFERGPAADPHIATLRRYAPQPEADQQEYEAERMRRESEQDAEQFFLEQQSPADSNFR